MTERVFRSPGFYSREIDLSTRTSEPSGTPAGIVGYTAKGPAFVPITVGSFQDFITKFGNPNDKLPATYAAQKWLEHRNALTFVRVLGAGANSTSEDITDTLTKGTVKNAGFYFVGSTSGITGDNRYRGVVQFLVAKHTVSAQEAVGFPIFTDNSSYFGGGPGTVNLIRAVIFTANDTRIMIMNMADSFTNTMDDAATLDANNKFKLIISSSAGSAFATTDGFAGLKILTASLDPDDDNYIGKILNTDPSKFAEQKHLLYADFPIDTKIAAASTATDSILITSGSVNTSTTSGDSTLVFRDAFGRYNTRYTTPRTPTIISQPFGSLEYDLFYIEAIDDGEYANTNFKISIANIRASTDPKYEYGTFSIIVRAFDDSDTDMKILEQFNNLSLDPNSENYVAKVIGDMKVYYNFDAVNPEDRKLTKRGKYPNRSRYIRVIMSDQVENGNVPKNCLPFGFRGLNLLKTNVNLTDRVGSTPAGDIRLSAVPGTADPQLLGSIIPPIPFRFKVTRGIVKSSPTIEGEPGPNEIVDSRFFWGVKFERITNKNNNDTNAVLNQNAVSEPNKLLRSIVKFMGIEKLDVLVTGSYVDSFNDNKFTLARVCLSNTQLTDITASVDLHMREAAYIRNGIPSNTDYTITDNSVKRLTFASLLQLGGANLFNKFSDYAKFNTIMYGGWNGVNILDAEASRFSDKATSTDAGGGANSSYASPGFSFNQAGSGLSNNAIFSIQIGTKILTDPMTSNINILAIPGIREALIVNDAMEKVKDYSLALYVADIPYYDFSGTRIFDGETNRSIDVLQTINTFNLRAIDNNYTAVYFPNVVIQDIINNKRVLVPASVAALAALAFNDKIAYPWFAPAGYNRAALDFVILTQVRINQNERDLLYQARINPIIKFPGQSYVIFSQKTLQQQPTALDSINIRRMLLEVKRIAIDIGNQLMFEQVNQATRNRLVNSLTTVLASIQANQGIDMFSVIADETNNTPADEEANRINCRVKLVPVRAVEFIALDFIITNSGVMFV